MLMPIVSMNKMSMNESVAASCCWRYVLGVHEQYPEILHGGKIGTTYEVILQLKGDYVTNGVASGWLSQGYDVTPDLAWQSISYNPDTKQWYRPGDNWIVNATNVAPYVVKSSCPHDDGSCSYYKEVDNYQQNMHIGATSAHANKKNWAEPHKAEQYSS